MSNNLLPKKLRIKFFAYKYGLYAFIFLLIIALSFLLGKHIEAVFLFVAFVFLRYKFPKTFHHHSTYWCVFWSVLSFWLCIVAVLPLKYSVLSGAVVEMILCFILYKIQDYVDIKAENQELKTPRFSLYTCSHDEFTAFCLKNKVRNDRVEYVWDLIRGSGNNNELADKYFVEPQTIKQDWWRYKKKFANVLDKTTTE